MDPNESLQHAAARLARAQQQVERGEAGLRLLLQSRKTFINSLRNTGLTYAQARLKFDNCMDEQRQAQQAALAELARAERHYVQLAQPAQAAPTA